MTGDVKARAVALVDGVRAEFEARGVTGGLAASRALGRAIARRLHALGDEALVLAVMDYMEHLAAETCGPGAGVDHVCIWRGGKASQQ